MAWRRSGDKPLSEPMMVGLPTHICVTRPQWVNTLGVTAALGFIAVWCHWATRTTSTVYWFIASKLKVPLLNLMLNKWDPFLYRSLLPNSEITLMADVGIITMSFCHQSSISRWGQLLCSVKNSTPLLFEILGEFAISIVMCTHLKIHCRNLISHFVIHNQIWYVWLHLHSTSNAKFRKYTIIQMSVTPAVVVREMDHRIHVPCSITMTS